MEERLEITCPDLSSHFQIMCVSGFIQEKKKYWLPKQLQITLDGNIPTVSEKKIWHHLCLRNKRETILN